MSEPAGITVEEHRQPYRLLPGPAGSPLVLFLHGAGERGQDNQRQLTWVPQQWPEPCFVLAPQCPLDQRWVEVPWDRAESTPLPAVPGLALRAALAALEHVLASAAVDPDRIYLTGLSMGGFGTWDLLARCPERFAAALPVCGGGDERVAHRMLGVPLWAWHGGVDPLVPAVRSRAMVAALRALGGVPEYSELPLVGHDVWRQAYGAGGALPWLFRQHRGRQGRTAVAPWPVVPAVAGGRPRAGHFAFRPGSAVAAPVTWQGTAAALAAELGLASVRCSSAAAGDLELMVAAPAAPYATLVLGDRALVVAADPAVAAAGGAVLAQLLTAGGGRCPRGELALAPPPPFLGVLVDCVRHAMPVAVLRQVVRLCWLLRIPQVVLHLTDREAFTFPSRALPHLPTPGRAYCAAELHALQRYAQDLGVQLVPALDVPGHCRAWVAADPARYGLADPGANPDLLHPARDTVLQDLDELLGEVMELFPDAPFVHLGGDEVDLAGVATDPECQAAMRQHGLRDPAELIGRFLGAAVRLVEARGRRALLWEGFRPAARQQIPGSALVCAWDGSFYPPDRLSADGFTLVNASFEPLYAVGGAEPRAWSSADLWRWNPKRFRHWQEGHPLQRGLELPDAAAVAGALFCVWEMPADLVLPALRARLPAFSERARGVDTGPLAAFLQRLGAVAPRFAGPAPR